MEIPEEYQGNLIISFMQRKSGGVKMLSYTLEQTEFYEKDKLEFAEKGRVIAEFMGVNEEFRTKAISCLEGFDREKQYQPGEVGIEYVLE